MIIFCTLFFALLIFPIFIYVDLYINMELNKIYVNINAFKTLRIIGGYISLYKKGVAFHKNERKAILFPFENILNFRKNVKPFLDYHIKKFNAQIYLGMNNKQQITNYLPYIYVWYNALFGKILTKYKPYLKYTSNLALVNDNSQFNVFMEITSVLNILMIFISLVKITMEKLLYAFNRQ